MDTTSCIMLSCNLSTPIPFGSFFREEDLQGTGVELDSHITLLYAPELFIDRHEALKEIGDNNISYIKSIVENETFFEVPELFELSSFSGESDYVILKLKERSELFAKLKWVNSKLSSKFKVVSEFEKYVPHLTLAEVKKGSANKYVNDSALKRVIKNSLFQPEDFVIGYDYTKDDYRVYSMTTNKTADRFFRVRENLRDMQI